MDKYSNMSNYIKYIVKKYNINMTERAINILSHYSADNLHTLDEITELIYTVNLILNEGKSE